MTEPTEAINLIFQAMKLGRSNYQIIRFPPTEKLMLDLRNGMLVGDVRSMDPMKDQGGLDYC